MSPEQLDAIRRRVDSATEGPWEVDADGGVSTESVPEGGQWSRPWSSPVPVVDTEGCGMGNPADAEFIAASRTDVPALLDEIERLSSLLAYTRESRDAHAATVDRVRKLAEHPSTVPVHVGGGNLVDRVEMVSAKSLRAAIEGTDS